jgi:hypothetical protein
MRPLSKEAEEKILSAIEKAAELVNAGQNPDAAIVKIASENNFPANYVRLMAQAYNTGCTNKHREAGETLNEKIADFKLADIDNILNTLYPSSVKTAAQIVTESAVSAEYALPPSGFIARRRVAMEKAAAALMPLPEKTYVAPPRDELAAAQRAYTAKINEKRAAEEIRRMATIAYSKAAEAMDEIAVYFRVPGNMAFGDALKQAELRLGDEGVSVLKKLAEVYPWLNKQAATGKPQFGNGGPCELINTVIEKLAEYKIYQEQFNAKAPKARAAQQKKTAEVITGSILYKPPEETLELKKADASTGITGPISATRALGGQLFGGVNSYIKSPDELKGEAFKDITDPDHDRKLRNIRAQGVLADLISNDPVISGHDPREVANAFNELAEVAPSFMDSTATVQALLRKRLEAGQLADFDIKQLIDMEKARAEQQHKTLTTQMERSKLL